MSRLKPVDKVCLHCSKKFTAKRSDAKFCSDKCRATASTIDRVRLSIITKEKPFIIAKAKPFIVAEAKAELIKQVVKDLGLCKQYDVCDDCGKKKELNEFMQCDRCYDPNNIKWLQGKTEAETYWNIYVNHLENIAKSKKNKADKR